MIENLVKEGFIQFVCLYKYIRQRGLIYLLKTCFSINLCSQREWGLPERLDDVKINNITGRAGRMLEHFAGNIFIVEPDEWQVKDYFDDNDNDEEKIPTYFKAINEDLSSVFQALAGVYAHDAGKPVQVLYNSKQIDKGIG